MIEVLKQALADAKRNERHNNVAETRYWLNQYKLIAEQAIAELESQEPVAWHESIQNQKKFLAEMEALLIKTSTPQRTEPPAWFPAVENILKEYGLQAMDFVADFKEAMKDAEQSQRTWVGLPDEEVRQMCGSVPIMKEAVREAEAKLKEKNT